MSNLIILEWLLRKWTSDLLKTQSEIRMWPLSRGIISRVSTLIAHRLREHRLWQLKLFLQAIALRTWSRRPGNISRRGAVQCGLFILLCASLKFTQREACAPFRNRNL